VSVESLRRAELYKAAIEEARQWLADNDALIPVAPALRLYEILEDALAEDTQGLFDAPNQKEATI